MRWMRWRRSTSVVRPVQLMPAVPALRPIRSVRPIARAGVVVLLVASVSGCTSAPTPTVSALAAAPSVAFPGGAQVDYQLGEAYPVPAGTGIVVRDSTAQPATGVYSICYVNGFQSQPGETARWLSEHPELVLGGAEQPLVDANWPDEIIFDTGTAAKRSAIAAIILPTIDRCVSAGFNAVEIDNLDSYTRSDGALTAADNIALVAMYAESAHHLGLAVGQKNAADLAVQLADLVGFDFAVAEECDRFDECELYTDAYGNDVIAIEYSDNLRGSFAEACARSDRPRSMVLRDRDLLADTAPGYVFEVCSG